MASRDEKDALSLHWEQRSLLELRAGGYFSQLLTELLVVGADPEVLELVARAPHDEVRHAEICRQTAAEYGDREVPWPAPGPTTFAEHEGVPPEMVATLHVVTMCCINETIAGAWLEACFAMSSARIARRAIRGLLREEIDHGRIGWAHLGSKHVTPRMRKALGKWAPHLIRAVVGAWLRPDRVVPRGGVPSHGIPSNEMTHEIVNAAVRDLVRPGFAHVGVRVHS